MERKNNLNTLKIAFLLSASFHLGLFLALKPFHKPLPIRDLVSVNLIESHSPLPPLTGSPSSLPPLAGSKEIIKGNPSEEKRKTEFKSEKIIKVEKPKEKLVKAEKGIDLEKMYREKIKQMEEKVKHEETLAEELEKRRQEAIKRIEERVKGVEGGGIGGVEGGGIGVGGDIYFSQLQQHVRRFWVIPEGFNPKGLKAVIRVKIDPEGRMLSAQIEQSSGNRIFDNSALQAVKRAEPYPPPPEKKTLEVGFVFRP